MNIITIVVAALTMLLLLSQLTCGLWMRKGAEESSKRFHTRLGIAGVLAGIVTAVLAIIAAA